MEKISIETSQNWLGDLLFAVPERPVKKSSRTSQQKIRYPLPKRGIRKDYHQVNLVGSNDEYSPARVDPNLINAWGMAFAPSGPDWVSARGRD